MSDKCKLLHKWFNQLERFRVPFNENNVPLNGIYILFEKNEEAHGTDRIVRVGTHTGKDQLRSRLKQHFLNENKDRSIFRKNIGRALLAKAKDPFFKQWELDLTTRKAKEKYRGKIDFVKQGKIEKEVTKYIQSSFSFIIFFVGIKEKRLLMEEKIISTISKCEDCKSSTKWLGRFSPKPKIRESGLWLENGLYKEELSRAEMEELKKLLFPRV